MREIARGQQAFFPLKNEEVVAVFLPAQFLFHGITMQTGCMSSVASKDMGEL
jgi:hypothetical protein